MYKLEDRFAKLNEKVRLSATGKQLEEFIASSKIGAVGTMASDFTQPDTSGIPISLAFIPRKICAGGFLGQLVWSLPVRKSQCGRELPILQRQEFHSTGVARQTGLSSELD